MYALVTTYGMLVAIAILAIVIILFLASRGWWFMKIAQGTTAFISAGDSLKAILPNVGGYRMSDVEDLDGRRWLVPEKDENEKKGIEAFFLNSLHGTVWLQKWLWKVFGVKFISLVWPHTHRHTFDIRSRKRLLEGANVKEGTPLKVRVVDSPAEEGTVVDSLLFLVPRPVYLNGMKLAGDNSRINLLLLPIYRQVIPALPVYYLKGDFFTQLDAAIETAMVDFFSTHRVAVHKNKKAEKEEHFAKDSFVEGRDEEKYEPSPLTYSHWLKLAKAGGNSPMELHLRNLNVSKKYRDDLKHAEKMELVNYIDKLTHGELTEEIAGEVAKEIPSGIIPRFGFALVSFRVVDWEPHSDTVGLAQALLAKETKFHTAEGVREEAYGKGDAIEAVAKAESSRYERLVNALVEKGVTPDMAAQVVLTQIRTENIRDGKVTTYVEGGARTSMMVGER